MTNFGFSSNIDLSDPENTGTATQRKDSSRISVSGKSDINTNYSNWDKIDAFSFGDGQFLFDGNAQTQYTIGYDSDLDGSKDAFSLLSLDVGNVRTNPLTIFVESEKGSTQEVQLNGITDGGNTLTFDDVSTFSNITRATITVGTAQPQDGEQDFILAFDNISIGPAKTNAPPEITEPNNQQVAENNRSVGQIEATDPDAGDSVTFSLAGGADQDAFTIDASTGALSFATAPDFEAPGDADGNNTYEVTVQASDGALSASQTLSVSVEDVNEAPAISTGANLSVDENTLSVVSVAATDPDAGDSVTFSLAGGADQDAFTIDASTGALSFATAPDFEAPGDADGNNTYEVTVQASDGALSASQTLSVSVEDVNEGRNGGQPRDDEERQNQKKTEVDPSDEPTEVEVGEGAGTPSLLLGFPATVGGTIEGETQKQTKEEARDTLLDQIAAKQSDPEETQALQDNAEAFLNSLPEGSEVTVTAITPSIEGEAAPDAPIEINGNEDPDSIESVVIDTRNLPSGTQININGVENVTFLGDVIAKGGVGDNRASANGANQIIVLGPGDDVLRGGGGDDEVRSLGGDDRLYGETGDDLVRGGNGDDMVDGGPGADRLLGDAGADTLVAGDGDRLVGGLGDDRVEVAGFTGTLTWVDPTPGDTLSLSDLDLTPEQVRVDGQGLSANQPAVLRLDVDADGSFAEDEPAIVLDRLARAEVAVQEAASGSTAIQLTGPDLPLADLSAEDQLASLYVAYFGRGADPAGLAFWEDRFESALDAGDSTIQALTAIAQDFRFSEEAFARFPVLDPESPRDAQAMQGFVESVYESLFNRTPEQAGLDFWTGHFQERIDSGQDIGTLLITIMAAARDADEPGEANDATAVRNKIEAAGALTDALDDSGLALGTDVGLDQVRDLLADTDGAYSSFETALEEIQALTTTGSDDGTM